MVCLNKFVVPCFQFGPSVLFRTYAGKIFILVWILFGICLVSLFTAIITTVMASILVPMSTSARPFYDEIIGVLEGSLDYLVLVKKSKSLPL